MTDWWKLIEDYLLAKDWTAVLVCADGLSDDNDVLADTLRWIAKKQLRWGYVDGSAGRKYYTHIFGDQHSGKTVREAVEHIRQNRDFLLEYYQ